MSELEQSRVEFEKAINELYSFNGRKLNMQRNDDGSYKNTPYEYHYKLWKARDAEIESLKERIDNLENQLIEYQTMLGL